MAVVPLALSVHNFISSVGADAGFASVIGLAILTLLYFAHARETASLREEAAGLAARLQEAEARLAEARAQAVVAQALPTSGANASGTAGLGSVQLLPAAPAGTAAPALAAATRFIPAVPSRPAPARRLVTPAVAPPPAPAAAPALAPARVPAPVVAAAPAATVEGPPPPPAPAPARAMPVSAPATSRLAPATVAGAANGASSPPRAPVPDREPVVVSAPPRFTPPARSPFTAPPARRSSPGARRFVMLVGALVLIGAAAAVVIITSGTGSTASSSRPPASNAPGPSAGAFDPSHVTVAVLNGTATNQLAHHVAARLAGIGYRKGVIATASNQTLTSTIVAYLPGSSNRVDALHVAKALHLRPAAVAPINQAAQAVACPPPAACTANVVVTVGADLAGT